MALLDFLKNRKQAKKSAKKPAKVLAVKKEEKVQLAAQPALRQKKSSKFSYEVIKQPHISEKGTYLSEKDQYVFEVSASANKKQIKDSIEGIYGVDVLSVNIIKVPEKKRRLGGIQGLKKGYKKAIVKIKQGQKIEIL